MPDVGASLSYAALAAASGYSLYNYCNDEGFRPAFPYPTFIIPTVHGIFGIVTHVLESTDPTILKGLTYSQIFINTFSLPCFATEIWLKHDVSRQEVAWAHAILGAIPAVVFVIDGSLKPEWIDLVVYINTLSSGVVSYNNGNTFGFGSAAAFLIGYLTLRQQKNIWFNIFTAVFTLCACKALSL